MDQALQIVRRQLEEPEAAILANHNSREDEAGRLVEVFESSTVERDLA